MKKLISSLLLCIACTFYSISFNSVFAQQIIFQDTFSEDLSKWQPIRDDGRYWSVVDGALQAYIPFGSTITELLPKSTSLNNLNNYVFEFDFKAYEGADKNISFGVVDRSNWYEIHFTDYVTEIAKVKNGTVIWSKQYPFILSNTTQHHFSITYKDGFILLNINGYKVFETMDPTFESNLGTIGMKASTGGIFPTRVTIDNVVIKKANDQQPQQDTLLGVRLLKQTDSGWATVEYDSATSWAQKLNVGNSIKEWGCNLLAQVMIMHYHGIKVFADNTPISPQSLNMWLLANDGYHNSPNTGNINKNTVSLLTTEISKKKGTPKLEFLYVKDNLLETAITEIEKGNPVILELDGHFVVADGFTADRKDLYIKDPAYNITKLSEHHLALKSVRLYTPSQTDLSYISIVSSPETQVEITRNGEIVSNNSYIEKLRAFQESTPAVFGPASKITEIAKPETASYEVKINNPTAVKASIRITVYTKAGKPQELLNKELAPGLNNFSLNYIKEGKSTIEVTPKTTTSFKQLRTTIKLLGDSNQIKQSYFEKILLQLVKSEETLNVHSQKKVLKVVKAILLAAPKVLITKPAKALLLDQVTLLLVNLK